MSSKSTAKSKKRDCENHETIYPITDKIKPAKCERVHNTIYTINICSFCYKNTSSLKISTVSISTDNVVFKIIPILLLLTVLNNRIGGSK